MAKIGQDAWATGHEKWLVWVKNKKCQKYAKKRLYDHIVVVVCLPVQKDS